jgi:hypothetical protein
MSRLFVGKKNGQMVRCVPNADIRITAQAAPYIRDNVPVVNTPIRQRQAHYFTK